MMAKVVSRKMEGAAVVEVERVVKHPAYNKRIRRRKKYLVHDPLGVKEGDKVSIESIKPMSKKKRFKIVEVVK
jgi:small subunit ribosomal protein S17